MSINFMYRLLLACFCLFPALPGACQQYFNQSPEYLKANGIWTFGDSTGLNFNAGGPAPFQTSMLTHESAASVADPLTGQLLFYTDAMSCWDASHQLMPNGSNLMGGLSNNYTTTQGACIVPVIGAPGKYYLFSLNFIGISPGLFYSIVDMNLNGGLGDVEVSNKAVLLNGGSLSEGMIAIPGDNCDVWLLLHKYPEPEFVTYHITAAGINTVPVISATGENGQIQGCIAVAPNRQHIAMANTRVAPYRNPSFQLAQFDPATGVVANAITLDSNFSYGVAFSPDNSKLYRTGRIVPGNYAYGIQQYDISVFDSATILGTAATIDSFDFGELSFSPYLKLYNDTIYIGGGHLSTLSRINQPNLAGVACNYQEAAVSMLMSDNRQGTTIYGLCNDAVFPLPPDTQKVLLLDTLLCIGNNNTGFNLELQATPGYSGYQWNNNATGLTRTITTPGTYWVLGKDFCHSRIDTFIVRERDLRFSLGNDTALCNAEAVLELDATRFGATYLWQDGSTGSTYMATGAGTYWVMVLDSGCTSTDTILVTEQPYTQDLGPDTVLCRESPVTFSLQANDPPGSTVTWSTGSHASSILVQDTGYYWVNVQNATCNESDTIYIGSEMCNCVFLVPTAFTPNGDGNNDDLKPRLAGNCEVSGFMLSIYNRFGQRVFFSADSDKGWDGTFNGITADVGTYFFELRFTGGRKKQEYYRKGDITLLR